MVGIKYKIGVMAKTIIKQEIRAYFVCKIILHIIAPTYLPNQIELSLSD